MRTFQTIGFIATLWIQLTLFQKKYSSTVSWKIMDGTTIILNEEKKLLCYHPRIFLIKKLYGKNV